VTARIIADDGESVFGQIVRGMIEADAPVTLLAVCPNSNAVVRAALRTAERLRAPAIFAATLNQVDLDGGYTGWTPSTFAAFLEQEASRAGTSVPVLVGLDHGGPWTRDEHLRDGYSFVETMEAVRASLSACIDAGYNLLHIDATVDPNADGEVELEEVIERTVGLIAFAEANRRESGRLRIAFEVGTEEVHGEVGDLSRFRDLVRKLRVTLDSQGLAEAWPVFFVGRVGTDLHTSHFDARAATELVRIIRPLGSAIKGHYTDYVDNPADYPRARVGGANVGPEFADVEVRALEKLTAVERDMGMASGFMDVLEAAVVASGRWRKWLAADERQSDFDALPTERRGWLTRTGSRYVWTNPSVVEARRQLYENVSERVDPDAFVLAGIEQRIERYVRAFNLVGFAEKVLEMMND